MTSLICCQFARRTLGAIHTKREKKIILKIIHRIIWKEDFSTVKLKQSRRNTSFRILLRSFCAQGSIICLVKVDCSGMPKRITGCKHCLDSYIPVVIIETLNHTWAICHSLTLSLSLSRSRSVSPRSLALSLFLYLSIPHSLSISHCLSVSPSISLCLPLYLSRALFLPF